MFLRVVEKRDDGIVVRGAKAHQTGSLSSHEIIVLPTRAMSKADKDYAVAFAIPSDTKGLIHVVGRSTLDMRELDGCDIGNVYYSKYCPTLIFDDVFVPWERVFMCGETEFAAGYGCKVFLFPSSEPWRLQVRQDRLHDRRGPHHDGLQRNRQGRPPETEGHRYDPQGGDSLRMLPCLFL